MTRQAPPFRHGVHVYEVFINYYFLDLATKSFLGWDVIGFQIQVVIIGDGFSLILPIVNGVVPVAQSDF